MGFDWVQSSYPTSSNIVGRNEMLDLFEYPVGLTMLDDIGSNLIGSNVLSNNLPTLLEQ